MEDFILAHEIEVADKRSEILRVLQHLREIGMDENWLNKVVPRLSAKSPVRKDESEPVGAQRFLVEIKEPKLEDYQFSEQTMELLRKMEEGVYVEPSFDTLQTKKRINVSSSLSSKRDTQQPLTEVTGNYNLTDDFTDEVFTCTPDIIKKKTDTKLKSSQLTRGTSTENRNPVSKQSSTNQKVLFSSLKSPVFPATPKLKLFSKDNIAHSPTSSNESNMNFSTQLNFLMDTSFYLPDSPELTVCLEKLKLK